MKKKKKNRRRQEGTTLFYYFKTQEHFILLILYTAEHTFVTARSKCSLFMDKFFHYPIFSSCTPFI